MNELIREALYPYPDELAIVSKVAGRRDAAGARVLFDEPHQLRQSIEENLTTLGADRLAAVNLRLMDPSATPGSRFDAQLAALVQAREEGLIDGIGLSNISRLHLRRGAAQTAIVCVQNLFNLADQRSLDVLRECETRNIAFVPFCPLGWPGETHRRLLSDPVLAAVARSRGGDPALSTALTVHTPTRSGVEKVAFLPRDVGGPVGEQRRPLPRRPNSPRRRL